ANADCKRILLPLPRTATIVQMIEACNRVGSVEHHTMALAEAFSAALNVKNKKCYNCGQTGHLKTQCQAKKNRKQGHPPANDSEKICERC
ncbi:POK9 protein, partial [Bucorvus abyssinicus]|nr:POK9 protein [Bucorvus abyssinicus]